MEFYDYLVRTFGYDEAILLSEISYQGYSLSWIKKMLKKLCNENKLERFDKGVYYIPSKTPLGKSKLDPKKVIVKKYIYDGTKVIGYFSGSTLLNILGLSSQVPNILEIYTNNEPSRVREVSVGNQKILLRHARATITDQNAATMCFLELMNFTDSDFYDTGKKEAMMNFINKNKITRESIARYTPFFPDKTLRTLVESGIIYDVAPWSRAILSNHLSAQDGIALKILLHKIVDEKVYKKDYQTITEGLLFENVPYEMAVTAIEKILSSELLDK